MKGKTEGKQDDSSSESGDINKVSEWNKLMLPIHQNAPSNWKYPENVNSPTENWNVGYTDIDLITNNNSGPGAYSWCQEYAHSTDRRLVWGYYGVSYFNYISSDYQGVIGGWRPVLEVVD